MCMSDVTNIVVVLSVKRQMINEQLFFPLMVLVHYIVLRGRKRMDISIREGATRRRDLSVYKEEITLN